MRFSTFATLTAFAVASGASADGTGSGSGSGSGSGFGPSDSFSNLISSLAPVMSKTCQSTLTRVVASGSPLSNCLSLPVLGPIFRYNNDSIAPKIDAYLKSVCSSPACSEDVIDDTTQKVWSGCSTYLTSSGITRKTLRNIMDAYPTARKVACLADNSTLCPVKLLQEQESYLGTNISTAFIAGLIISADNGTSDSILQYVNNPVVSQTLLCNDCVQAGVDVVLSDYPRLENTTFHHGNDSSDTTIPSFYQGLCGTSVSANATWPKSINSTASDDKSIIPWFQPLSPSNASKYGAVRSTSRTASGYYYGPYGNASPDPTSARPSTSTGVMHK